VHTNTFAVFDNVIDETLNHEFRTRSHFYSTEERKKEGRIKGDSDVIEWLNEVNAGERMHKYEDAYMCKTKPFGAHERT
jgi:hypothetical protein